ncbi:MAG: glutamate--tRNA ligase [Planctomycetota bacterium]|nr:glutamate--tRNA ligase [Planctomycetota bacterium]
MADVVRVRFAPSPTGDIHIGNLRAAIHNFLFARHEGGKFLLRIEDTDKERNTPQAIASLLDYMAWMGLDFDEPPVYQSKSLAMHQEAAERLLKSGHAYRSTKGAEGKGEAVVFRLNFDVSYTDIVKGPLTKSAADLKDFVILRSDGTPTFHLANVVDDIAMGITHVIRGDDHVENTFKHVPLFRALGAEPPKYAHLPQIVNDKGKPLSKRDGDVNVGEFRAKGYLPDALFNALALCGWSPGDDREMMTREEMIAAFSLERVRPSPARFDYRKLEWFNSQYIARMPAGKLRELLEGELAAAGLDTSGRDARWWDALLDPVRPRLKTLKDFVPLVRTFFEPPETYDPKDVRKHLDEGNGRRVLEGLAAVFGAVADWTAQSAGTALQKYAEEKGLKFGDAAQPLRVALNGRAVSLPMDVTLFLMGKDEVLARIRRCLQRAGAAGT